LIISCYLYRIVPQHKPGQKHQFPYLSGDTMERSRANIFRCALKTRRFPVATQNSFCVRTPGMKKREMNTDHSPFYCDPKGLAAIINEEARL